MAVWFMTAQGVFYVQSQFLHIKVISPAAAATRRFISGDLLTTPILCPCFTSGADFSALCDLANPSFPLFQGPLPILCVQLSVSRRLRSFPVCEVSCLTERGGNSEG